MQAHLKRTTANNTAEPIVHKCGLIVQIQLTARAYFYRIIINHNKALSFVTKTTIMSEIKLHTIETAPEGSKAELEASKKLFGSIPNLHAVLAESPNALIAYKNLHYWFENSSFNTDEITVVWMSINVEHECHYCVPAHTAIAKMMKVDDEIIEALRNETVLPSEQLDVLRATTLAMVRERGRLSEATKEKFFKAEYDTRHLFDIILGLAQKTISNYVNHVVETPIDKGFEKFKWERAANPAV